MPSWQESLEEAVAHGIAVGYFARRKPDAIAVESAFGARTFAELDANANRLARLFAASGMKPGDAVAVVSRNRPAFIETYCAAQRSGMRFTPVNFHLTAEESGYVIDNCEAKLVVYDGGLASAAEAMHMAPACRVRLIVDGEADGFEDYGAAIARFDSG